MTAVEPGSFLPSKALCSSLCNFAMKRIVKLLDDADLQSGGDAVWYSLNELPSLLPCVLKMARHLKACAQRLPFGKNPERL